MAIKYKLPKSWDDVTVPQLMELEQIDKDESINKEISPAIVRTCLILSLFTGFPYEHFEEMKISEVKKLAEKISFLKDYPNEKAVQYFWCGGLRWKVNFNVNELTGGQFIDHYELTKNPDTIMQHCNKIMAMYCEPKKLMFFKKKMSDEKKSEILLKAPVSVVYPLTFFFCNLYPHLLNATKDYLKQQQQSLMNQLEEVMA